MKAVSIAKKAAIINKISRDLLEVNKQLVIQKPQQAAEAITFFNKQTTALFDQINASKNEEEMNNAWLDYSVVISGYIVAHDLLIDID